MSKGIKQSRSWPPLPVTCGIKSQLEIHIEVEKGDTPNQKPLSVQESRLRKLDLVNKLDLNHLYQVGLSKCQFACEQLRYLGHVISAKGIGTVEVISRIVAPKNVKQLRQFLGAAGYYRRFIDHLAKMVAPLYLLLRKDTVWEWTQVHQKAYEDLKNTLTMGSNFTRV